MGLIFPVAGHPEKQNQPLGVDMLERYDPAACIRQVKRLKGHPEVQNRPKGSASRLRPRFETCFSRPLLLYKFRHYDGTYMGRKVQGR